MINTNKLLDDFVDLIRDLEKVPRDCLYRIRIRYKIKKLKRAYTHLAKKKEEYTCKDILEFGVLLNTLKSMKIINNFEVSAKDLFVGAKTYKIDPVITGIAIHLNLVSNGQPTMKFNLKTKKSSQDESLCMDIALEMLENKISDYGVPTLSSKVYNLTNIDMVWKRHLSKFDVTNVSYEIITNILVVYYNYIFNELERRYLDER